MNLPESRNASLPHSIGVGRSSMEGCGRRDRVIMTGPQLLVVVSEVCAREYGAGRARDGSKGSTKGIVD